MNLRDHVDVAMLIARLAHPASSCDGEMAGTGSFWKQIRALEILWEREQRRVPVAGVRAHFQLVAEVLTTGLLAQVMAAAGGCLERRSAPVGCSSLDAWRLHRQWREGFLKTTIPLRDRSGLRIEKLERRLAHWGDLLVSHTPGSDDVSTDQLRWQEMRQERGWQQDAVWPLIHKGIVQAVPAIAVTDLLRSAVHRLLHEQALRLVPAEAFLKDGRLKPRSMRMIEGGLRGAS